MNSEFYRTEPHADSSCLVVGAETDEELPPNHPAEIEYALAHFHSPSRREEWLQARRVLKLLLRHSYGVVPESVCVLSDALQRPLISSPDTVADRKLNVSLAHKEGLYMAGASLSGPVGVDVETKKNDAKALTAIRRACLPEEIRAASLHPDLREEDFLHLTWCLKECCVKAGVARSVFDSGNAVEIGETIASDVNCIAFNARFFSFDMLRASAWLHENFYAAMITA